MSKLSFRARALDALKPLPVFRCEDLPDLHEYASINRTVPQMPTGMEKDEESVWMLQNGRLCVKRFTRYFGAVLQCAPNLVNGLYSWIYLIDVCGVKNGVCQSVPTRIVQQNTKGVM
uniref:Enhancer of polycomb homolog 1 (Drosophila) a n=1 Tax=Cyprinus carpio carpio TaxID=630221 RepID=A0A9J8CPQ9_CYPCA